MATPGLHVSLSLWEAARQRHNDNEERSMQLVFLHGPGAGGCAKSFRYQNQHFRGSLAPDLPGHPHGRACANVQRYTDWVRGWLWAQGKNRDLVLSGFTLGSCVALQYALDYPEEVKGLVLMTVAMRPKNLAPEQFTNRLRAAEDPVAKEQWLDNMREIMHFIDPAFREELVDCHRKIGARVQHDDLVVTESFDVRDRIGSLKPPLLLIRGMDDILASHNYEEEIYRAVPGSKFLGLHKSGHFPMAEQPAVVNRAIEEFIATLD
jgi:pimeloyl-ACP methyl ester carboxylesterase